MAPVSRFGRLEPQIPHLRRYARALVRDQEQADDLVQDCLERAMSRWHLWRPTGSLRAWLFTILHNLHVNAVTQQARRGYAVPLETDGGQVEPSNQHERTRVTEVVAALDDLPVEQRRVLLLVALEEFTYAEAAAITGVPIGTVMSRLARGREALRRLTDDKVAGAVLRRVK